MFPQFNPGSLGQTTTTTPALNLGAGLLAKPTTTSPSPFNPVGGGQPAQPGLNLGQTQQAATTNQPATLTINTSSNQQQNPGQGQTTTTTSQVGQSQGAQGQAVRRKQPASMKSFRFVLSSIQSLLQSLNYKGVDSFVRVDAGTDAIKNLQSSLLYFKAPIQQGDQASRKKVLDTTNPLIWGDKNPLTPRIANELVIKLAETLNLDEVLTFDLLESYFLTNESTRKLLVYMITIDINITNAESQIPLQQNAMQNLQLLQRGLKNIDTWKAEFNNVVLQAFNEAQIVYFQERTAMLQCILAILSNPGTKDRQPSTLVKDILAGGKLEQTLIDSLKKNKDMLDVFTQLSCSMREVMVSLQREEILILSCLNKIYSEYETPKVPHLIDFLKYQSQTRFRGLKLRNLEYQTDVTIAVQSQKITSLAVQLYFNYLQLQEFTSKTAVKQLAGNERLKKFIISLVAKPLDLNELSKLIQDLQKPLEDIDAVIYLTFKQVCEAIVKLDLLTAFGQGAHKNLFQFDNANRNDELAKSHLMEFIAYLRQGDQHFNQEPSTATVLAVAGGSQKEDLQLLIQDWINLVYSFFKANRMEESIALAQDITFSVICQPSQLKYVWGQISNGNGPIIGMKGGIGAPQKVIYSTIDIFENILQDPFDMENQGKFYNLMKALCGDKNHPSALEVLNLLQQSQMSNVPAPRGIDADQNVGGGWSVLQYLIKQFIDFSAYLEKDNLSTRGQQDFLTLIHFIAKMLSQSYLVYPEINSEAIALVMDLESMEDNLLMEKPRQDNIRRSEPILYHLFQCFYVVIQKLPLEASTDALAALVNSFTTIYKNLDLQPLILSQINDYKNYSGVPLMLEFFIFNLDENESKQIMTYKLTRAFLKFTGAILKQPGSSIGYLENNQRANVGQSLVEQLITNVYQTVYQNFIRLQFKEMEDFLKLYLVLLKTTKTILQKYQDIAAPMKIGLCHKYPQYDEVLRITTDCLNGENLEFLLINSIMLSEQMMKQHSTGITNKFWVEHLVSIGTGSSSHEEHESGCSRLLVQKVITQGLKCLNLIIQLSYTGIQSEQSGVLIGAKHYYSSKLKCVENITNLVKYPGQWELYPIQTSNSSVSYSLFNIVSYYIKPHLHLCPFMTQVQIESVIFFTLCCRIWEVQPIGDRVSLESTLRTTNVQSQEIRMKFVNNFKSCCKSLGQQALLLDWLVNFLDLLITCCSTQSQFVADIFKEGDFAQIFQDELISKSIRKHLAGQGEPNPAVKALFSSVESRVIILLSEMANNKVYDAFLRKLSENDHMNILENYIKPCLLLQQHVPNFEYYGDLAQNRLLQQSIEAQNNNQVLHVREHCSAHITLRYYLRLLQDEFQRDISGGIAIKKVIRMLCELPHFVNGAIKGANVCLTPQMIRLQKINQILAQDDRSGGRHLVRELCQNIEQKPGKLTQDQIDMMANVDNKLVTSDDCPVFLNQNQVNLAKLHQWLVKNESMKPFQMLQSSSGDQFEYERLYSGIGPQFCINIEEFSTIAKVYFYDNSDLVAEVRSATASFNLAVSHYYSYQVFISGLSDFIVEIGKSSMRENMRSRELVLENRAFCTSLFNLVVSESITQIVKNPGILSGTQNKLAILLIDFAKPMAKKLQAPSISSEVSTVLEVYQTQIELDFLSVLLGSINAAAEIGDYSKDILKALDADVITPMIKGLPKLRQKVAMPSSTSINKVVGVINEVSDRIANKMFINLVLQIFNLSIQLDTKDQMMSQAQQATELDFVQILSSVVKIMQDTKSNSFIEGLKIIQTGFSLISSENVNLFMRKSDTQALKVIINKFLQAATSIEEKVKIVEFLTAYARIDQGAEHLQQENILKSLGVTQIVSLVNQVDFYLLEVGQSEAKRNPVHILWCQILLLVRTLNHLLMSESPEYRRTIPVQISYQWSRMQALLEFGMHLKEQRFDHKSVSLALYEELELMTGIISQYFDYTDELFQMDFDKYVDIKDRLLFGVLHLFVQDFPASSNSATEKYLSGMTHDKLSIGVLRPGKYNGLDQAIDTLKIRIYFNTVSALLNACLINQNRASREDFINTWDSLNKTSESKKANRSQGSYAQTQFYNPVVGAEFENFRSLSQLSAAVANMNAAQQNLSQSFKFWASDKADQPLSQLYSNVQKVILHDEWINNEYMGLNNFFAGPSWTDLLDQYEQALSMSYLVSGILLAKLKESYDAAEQAGYLQYQTAISMKNLIDLGEQIVNDFRSFENEVKRSNPTAPDKIKRVQDQGRTIEKMLDKIRKGGPQYGGGSTSTFKGAYDDMLSRGNTQFSKYR